MSDLISNRKAYYNYEIVETFEAGIVLVGSEIKSLRSHGGNIQDGYVVCHKGEAYLKNVSISPYHTGSFFNHEERRERKLLLHRKELNHLQSYFNQPGIALLPLAFYFSKGRIKVRLGVGRGKKKYDKRAAIKSRDDSRIIARSLKNEKDL